MTDSLTWLIPEQVLQLTLPETLTTDSLQLMSHEIENALDGQQDKIIILIDANAVKANYHTSDILRALIPFTSHPQLKSIIAVSGNKLTRLVLLMAFATILVPMMRFENHQQANEYLKKIGITK